MVIFNSYVKLPEGIAAMVAYGPQQGSATSGGCLMLPLQVAGRKPHPSPSWWMPCQWVEHGQRLIPHHQHNQTFTWTSNTTHRLRNNAPSVKLYVCMYYVYMYTYANVCVYIYMCVYVCIYYTRVSLTISEWDLCVFLSGQMVIVDCSIAKVSHGVRW